MEYEILGGTGLRVSRLCLGTMMFGPQGNSSLSDCRKIIDQALDSGINFVDTADIYSDGESERIVGAALRGKRSDVYLATKFGLSAAPGLRGGSRQSIIRSVEASLTRMQTDYIDLYQIHRYDADTDLEEVLFTLTELVNQGKVRYFGSSMFSPDRIVESHWRAENRHTMRFRTEQVRYSIFSREAEETVLHTCSRYGMGVAVWSPLDGGYLSGKYRTPGDLSSNSRIARFEKLTRGRFDPSGEVEQRKLALCSELSKLAGEAALSLPQMAIAFTLANAHVTSAIVGPRTLTQLMSLLPAGTTELDTDTLNRIDMLVPPGCRIANISLPNSRRGKSRSQTIPHAKRRRNH